MPVLIERRFERSVAHDVEARLFDTLQNQFERLKQHVVTLVTLSESRHDHDRRIRKSRVRLFGVERDSGMNDSDGCVRTDDICDELATVITRRDDPIRASKHVSGEPSPATKFLCVNVLNDRPS